MLESIIGYTIAYIFFASMCFRILIEVPHWHHGRSLRDAMDIEGDVDTGVVFVVLVAWFLAPFVLVHVLWYNHYQTMPSSYEW